MPETIVTDVTEIDLSKLISYTMSFEPLQLILNGFTKRLRDTENANERHEEEIAELKRTIEELQKREMERLEEAKKQPPSEQEEKDETKKDTTAEEKARRASTHGQEPVDLRELYEEIENLKKMVGEAREPKRRHTIEELYAARRRKRSESGTPAPSARTPTPKQEAHEQAAPSVPGSEAVVGDIILERAREQLFVGTGEVPEVPFHESTLAEPATGEAVEPVRHDTTLPPVEEPLGAREEASPAGEEPLPISRHETPLFAQVSGGGERSSMRLSSDVSSAQQSRSAQRAGDSICERLRQDGVDIEYLNRVVAEMLSEMKALHADVDYMRTISLDRDSAADNADDEDLARRVRALEDALNQLRLSSSPSGSSTTQPEGTSGKEQHGMQNLDLLRRLPGALEEIRRLNERLNALERLNENLSAISGDGSGEDTSFSSAMLVSGLADVKRQLAELQAMGLRNYDDDIAALQEAIRKLQEAIPVSKGLRPPSDRQKSPSLAPSPVGAGASDEAGAGATSGTPDDIGAGVHDARDYEAAIQELQKHLEELNRRLGETEGSVKYLDGEKADRATLQRFNDDLQQLRRLLEISAGSRSDADATGLTNVMQEELNNMQKQLADQLKETGKSHEATTSELDLLREYVEKIDNCKADATLVANKAERDYVENALERLMREVEQVLNATNAGLIDTLDRSLNVLRDMLEGKATKQDMAQLQRIMAEESSGAGAADALMGFKGYRCLGCNRPVETMRPRVMANRLQPFVNRLPQTLPNDNTARIQQRPQSGATDGTSGGAGS